MKVFLDSNFLISALATRGLSADLLELLLEISQPLINQQVKNEVLEKLHLKFNLPKHLIEKVENLIEEFEIVPDSEKVPYSLRDPEDEGILSAAIQAKCQYLLTGDKDLLVVKEKVQELTILNPRDLWIILKGDQFNPLP
ncbi:MAG: putative toxin-antitoxin system toxin component, PIN family [Marinoscillum sp.]